MNDLCNGRALLPQIAMGHWGVVLAQETLQSPLEVGASGLQLGQPWHIVRY